MLILIGSWTVVLILCVTEMGIIFIDKMLGLAICCFVVELEAIDWRELVIELIVLVVIEVLLVLLH